MMNIVILDDQKDKSGDKLNAKDRKKLYEDENCYNDDEYVEGDYCTDIDCDLKKPNMIVMMCLPTYSLSQLSLRYHQQSQPMIHSLSLPDDVLGIARIFLH